jgi:hypothetical protein
MELFSPFCCLAAAATWGCCQLDHEILEQGLETMYSADSKIHTVQNVHVCVWSANF